MAGSIHISQHFGLAIVGTDHADIPMGAAQTFGPVIKGSLHAVTAAEKIALEPGCRLCCIQGVDGTVYVRSGTGDSPDISGEDGMRIVVGMGLAFAVAEGHDHLLVIGG